MNCIRGAQITIFRPFFRVKCTIAYFSPFFSAEKSQICNGSDEAIASTRNPCVLFGKHFFIVSMCSHHTQHALSSLPKSGQHKPKTVNLVLANFLKVLTLNVGEGREEEEAANQERTRPDPEMKKT